MQPCNNIINILTCMPAAYCFVITSPELVYRVCTLEAPSSNFAMFQWCKYFHTLFPLPLQFKQTNRCGCGLFGCVGLHLLPMASYSVHRVVWIIQWSSELRVHVSSHCVLLIESLQASIHVTHTFAGYRTQGYNVPGVVAGQNHSILFQASPFISKVLDYQDLANFPAN